MKTDSWQSEITQQFIPGIAMTTLVADPDGLLLDEHIYRAVQNLGFEVLTYDDPLAFRHVYELNIRSRRDQGETIDLVVAMPSSPATIDDLPYDLLQGARRLSLSLADIFTYLSYPIVAALGQGELDLLAEAYHEKQPLSTLGDDATREYILQHVFDILLSAVNRPEDLLRVLLRLHYRQQRLPTTLEQYTIEQLGHKPALAAWPISDLIQDRAAFLVFLQNQWPYYLDTIASKAGATTIKEHGVDAEAYVAVPFEHDDVRVYIDNYFVEGLLTPIEHPASDLLNSSWVVYGLDQDPTADRLKRINRLAEQLRETLPSATDARFQDWLTFAQPWASFVAMAAEAPEHPSIERQLRELQQALDAQFIPWIRSSFTSLHNQPPTPPVMVHHIPRMLARRLETDPTTKLALLVLDGMAYSQWLLIRRTLSEQLPHVHTSESAVFAWIPTITPVSRQALFSGQIPSLFKETIASTGHDEKGWRRYWQDAGLDPHQVFYRRNIATPPSQELAEELSNPHLKAVGLVVNQVDDMVHSTQLGKRELHNQVTFWAETGALAQLVKHLFLQGFDVWITADHGNIEAVGCGQPREGALADLRGERVRVYPNETLLQQVQSGYPTAIPWPKIGLPFDFCPLVLTDRSAFVSHDKTVLSHGSISLEEVIVPLVHLEQTHT